MGPELLTVGTWGLAIPECLLSILQGWNEQSVIIHVTDSFVSFEYLCTSKTYDLLITK